MMLDYINVMYANLLNIVLKNAKQWIGLDTN